MPSREAGETPGNVKTTVDLPQDLWRAAKIRAMDEHSDLRSVVIAALRSYLGQSEGIRRNAK